MQEIDCKNALAKFRPERVIFVVSVDRQGKPSGMAAGWFMTCSSDPFFIAVALSKKSYTRKLIQESKEFTIAVPGKNLEKELLFFGSCHGDKVDKFAETGLRTERAKSIRPPLLRDATINFECKLEQEVDTGDHTLFSGRIVHSYLRPDGKILMNMGKVDNERIFEEFKIL